MKGRHAFITDDRASSREEAHDLCLWASVVVIIYGGFLCFEFCEDAFAWRAGC